MQNTQWQSHTISFVSGRPEFYAATEKQETNIWYYGSYHPTWERRQQELILCPLLQVGRNKSVSHSSKKSLTYYGHYLSSYPVSVCSIYYKPIRLTYYLCCKVMFLPQFVCLSPRLLRKLWTDSDEIFWTGEVWPKEQSIRFCSWSRSRSGSSREGFFTYYCDL